MKSLLANIYRAFVRAAVWQKILVIIILLGLIWFGYANYIKGSSQKTTYQTDTAQKGTLIVSVSATGNAISSNYIDVSSQANGIVKEVYVKDGDIVSQGQKIAEITLDQTGIKNQTQAWANYLSAKNSVDSASANQYSLQSDMFNKWKDYMKLAQNSTYQNSDGSPNTTNRALPEFYIAQDDWLAAEAKYKSQQAVISQAQSSLSNAWATYQLTSSTVTAPDAGKINNITIIPGMPLSSTSSTGINGSSTSTSNRVAVIQKEGTPIITANLTEIDVPTIKVGQKATITFDGIKDKTFTGKVAAVDRIGSISNGVTSYPVTISLDTQVSEVLPNMSAAANIITQTKDDVLLVPVAAVTTTDGISTVRVMKNGAPQTVNVEIGTSSDTQVEIISGISEGDTVVTGTTSPATAGTTSVFSTFGGGRGGNAVRIRN
jgi:multidrug efflux pump subunit AcrA (membrane-fusion protein)